MSSPPSLSIRGRLARSVYAEREDKNVTAPDQFALGLAVRFGRWLALPPAREVKRIERALQGAAARLRGLDHAALVAALREAAPRAVHRLAERDLHRALGLSAGLQAPGGPWPSLLLMCAGIASPGTLGEVLGRWRTYVPLDRHLTQRGGSGNQEDTEHGSLPWIL